MSQRRHLPNPEILVARCDEIQTSLGAKEVPEFDTISEIGMAVRLALQVRGLPLIDFQTLKLVCSHYLAIPTLAVDRIVRLLAEVDFVRLQQDGKSIKAVLPTVPYYEELYTNLGEFVAAERTLSEPEQLAIALSDRLAASPENVDSLQNKIGADPVLLQRNIDIGVAGNYLVSERHRGRTILLNPTYFSENSSVFADAVAKNGASSIQQVLSAVRQFQGWPLVKIATAAKIGSIDIVPEQIALLKKLAADGAVKPPVIKTTYAGENYFMFTPTPGEAALSPTKRDTYERAMAIVAAVRQGQLLPRRYAIHSPHRLLLALAEKGRLRANTEATQQYKNLTHLRIGRLIASQNGFSEFHVLQTKENQEALDIAISLVAGNQTLGMSVNDDAREALQQDQTYIESLIGSSQLRTRETVMLNEQQQHELDLLLTGWTR